MLNLQGISWYRVLAPKARLYCTLDDAYRSGVLANKPTRGFLNSLADKLYLNKDIVLLGGIVGRTASGKSTSSLAATKYALGLHQGDEFVSNNLITHIAADNYYKDVSKQLTENGSFINMLRSGVNLDEPNAMRLPLLLDNLQTFKSGENIKMPLYDYKTSAVTDDVTLLEPANLGIVDSIFALNPAFNNPKKPILDLGIAVNVPPDLQWARYIKRAPERGMDEPTAKWLFNMANENANIHMNEVAADLTIKGEAPLTLIASKIGEFFKVLARA